MKTNNCFYGLAIAATLMAGCNNDVDFGNESFSTQILRVTVEDGQEMDSRVGFNAQGKFYWSANDAIGVTTTSEKKQFTKLNIEAAGKGQAQATFSAQTTGTPEGYAVYPYSDDHSISGTQLSYVFPASYTYSKVDADYFTTTQGEGNSFNPVMWGSINNGSVAFQHLGGVFCIKIGVLPTGDNLKLVLSAAQKLNGTYSTTLTGTPEFEVTATDNNAEKSVSITFSNSNASTSGVFYIPVPTGEYTNVRLKVLDGDTEKINIACGSYIIGRKSLKKIETSNQGVSGSQTASVADLSGVSSALSSASSVSVTGTISGENNTLSLSTLPDNASISFENIASGAKIRVDETAGNDVSGNVTFSIPATSEGNTPPSLDIDLPNATVTLSSTAGEATYNDVVSKTADQTLIIGAGVTVKSLTVQQGNVMIEAGGEINKITNNSGGTIYVIYKAATAPTIETGDGVVLMSVAEWESTTVVTNAEELSVALSDSDVSTIVLDNDLTLSDILFINRAITLNGNGKTLTSTAGRAINVETEGSVTIQNLIINAAERAINIINKAATVNVNKVTATANNNAVMIATSAGAAKLTVEDSDLTGLAVINVAGAGAQVEIKNTKITNVDNNASEAYGAITISGTAENSKVSVDANSTITVAGDSKKAYVFPGTATVTGVDNVGYVYATIGDNGCESLAEAIEEANAGQTIIILRDITITELIKVEKAITIDLNEKTVSANCQKAFEIYADATIKNGTIISQQRCVDTRKAVNLTLTDLTLNAPTYYAAHGNQQPLTIGGSDNGTKVTMSGVTMDAGYQGYCIISFVKTELTATDSNLSGYAALYVKEGSDNSTFGFVNSTLSGTTGNNDVEGNSFATIAIEANSVTVTMDNDCTLNSTGTYHSKTYIGEGLTESTITGPTAE